MHRDIKRNLGDLINSCGDSFAIAGTPGTVTVSSIEYDSRKVREGSLFAAVEGYALDGHDFIPDAVKNGAAAVLVSSGRFEEFSSLSKKGICVISTDSTRPSLAKLSAAFFDFPTRKITVIGITGTNGKTSTTYMLEAVLNRSGYVTGVIGTVNYRWGHTVMQAPNTTPESRDLQELFCRMLRDGVTAVVMEVSSHALELGRVEGIDFNAAVFTNLTGDHLDFHKDFESYFNAKKKLFDLLDRSVKVKKFGLINTDDDYGRRIYDEKKKYGYPLVSLGLEGDAFYRPDSGSIRNTITGLSYIMESPARGAVVDLGLSGRFHVYNSLCAFAVSCELGISIDTITAGLSSVKTVPGRFDVITAGEGFSIVVDYAHTSDAMLKLLQSVRELSPARIITLFGCGGDRDRTKRPLMGKIAGEYSDWIIITSDNPRTEEPQAIINEILGGMAGNNFEVIVNREEAIKRAVSMGQEGDIIVVAGKGHEDYQIIGTRKIHFDDREMAQKFIMEKRAG